MQGPQQGASTRAPASINRSMIPALIKSVYPFHWIAGKFLWSFITGFNLYGDNFIAVPFGLMDLKIYPVSESNLFQSLCQVFCSLKLQSLEGESLLGNRMAMTTIF
jgi:hypothetical protein